MLSSDQDTDRSSSGTPLPGKLGGETASSGVRTSSKSKKKHGASKDTGGGVMAAVTKKAAKLSNRTIPSAQAVHTPDTNTTDSSTVASPVISPVLEAISAAAIPSVPQSTTEWAKSIPFSSSPGNLINLGESPPTVPSSYEDRPTPFGWSVRGQEGTPSLHPQSASPPSNRRPLSYQMESNFGHLPDDRSSSVSAYGPRRYSGYSQHTQNLRYGPQPPLPHQAQPHFYGAPDPNLLFSTNTPLTPGENGYYCGFDSIPSSDSTKPAESVVITGYENGLSIFSVTKRGLSRMGTIKDIRGGVYNAKILPWSLRGDTSRKFPLIAVVTHGLLPVLGDSFGDDLDTISNCDTATPRGESFKVSPRAPTSVIQNHDVDDTDHYQTSVEVYSISNGKFIATLLSLPKTLPSSTRGNHSFNSSAPVGSLALHADGGNLIITSGVTGETWIYRQEESQNSSQISFRSLGKIWTTVQHELVVDSTSQNGSVDGDWSSLEPTTPRQQYNSAILSLNGRWLAYCPPSPSSQVSLRALVAGNAQSFRAPGLNTHAPPQLPTVNCQVETPGGDSMLNKFAQVATQEVIKGATWVGKQGVQAWNSYWNKSPPNQKPSAGNLQPQNYPNPSHQFPPTHGASSHSSTSNRDPSLISILDLDILANSISGAGSSSHPIATFRVPHGCSFLSFAPGGLALFTASSKGDIQCVWDLMRLQYAKSSFLKPSVPGAFPHVRQIALFSRMTIARVVDVVWTLPYGERAAMVTEPGTVHILDLPASAFTWPPPRRRTTPAFSEDAGSEIPAASMSAAGVASSAVSSLWTAARPLVRRPRRSSIGISGISAANITSQAGHGTQALAAGISRSVGAATGKVNEMRKAGSTRLHLPPTKTTPNRACAKILNGKHNDTVVVVGGGVVGLYTVRSRRADRPADKQKVSKGAKYTEFKLPSLPDPEDSDPNIRFDAPARIPRDSRWALEKSPERSFLTFGSESSIPQAEIESSAPYQPFHTDRRIGIHIYPAQSITYSPSASTLFAPQISNSSASVVSAKDSFSPWAFGGPIQSVKLDVGPPQDMDDDEESLINHRALPSSAMERVMKFAESGDDSEQIVVTTRKRRGGTRPEGLTESINGEGFFEDDCEVLDFASQRV